MQWTLGVARWTNRVLMRWTNRVLMRWTTSILVLLVIGGCELREVTLAQPEDIVVAEVVLIAGEEVQTAWVHHTRVSDPGADPRVSSATIEISAQNGQVLRFSEAADSLCFERRRDAGNRAFGSCYTSDPDQTFVQPGSTYLLTIRTTDGRVLTGSTTVPGDFAIVQPGATVQRVASKKHYDITWTQSANAWVYVTDAWFHDLRQALAPTPVPQDPLLLSGVSISGRDTTLTFPKEIGIFDRFENELTPVLVALQNGLPENVRADVIISAADRNYVNWVRAGAFNPSGQVRVPSVHGEGGTGVFGSVVQRTILIHTRR